MGTKLKAPPVMEPAKPVRMQRELLGQIMINLYTRPYGELQDLAHYLEEDRPVGEIVGRLSALHDYDYDHTEFGTAIDLLEAVRDRGELERRLSQAAADARLLDLARACIYVEFCAGTRDRHGKWIKEEAENEPQVAAA